MTPSWKSLFSTLLLAAGVTFFLGSSALVPSIQAQEGEEVTEEVFEETDELGDEELAEGTEGSEEAVVTPEVKGPDPDAKGAPATPYMHGSSDEKATFIGLSTLADKDQKDLLNADSTFPLEGENTGVVVLSGKKARLGNSVLDAETIMENRGDVLRFHIWIKADGVTAKDHLWTQAPGVTLELFDDNGNPVASATGAFKTRGTYPWHNYYVDIEIPRNLSLTNTKRQAFKEDSLLAALGLGSQTESNQPGLYLTLSCLSAEGSASFAALSYERISARDRFPKKDILDDATATLAPNPEFDELPMLLYYGLDVKLPWRFLDGNKSFSGIRTVGGLKSYLAQAKNDWFHIQKGVAMLPYLFVTANTLKLTDGFEEGWLEALRQELEGAQDSVTGFWKVNGVPNLLGTSALARHCFSPVQPAHADAEVVPTPWNSCGPDATLKYGRQIIRALLEQQVGATGAWNSLAFQPEEVGKDIRGTRTELLPTTAAVCLLAQARDTLQPDETEYIQAEDAIQKAYEYALDTFVLRNQNLWRESNTQGSVAASPAGMLELINATRVLEHRVNADLPTPAVTCTRRSNSSSSFERAYVTWEKPEKGLVSVRIYAAPEEFNPALLSEKHLIGVIERPNASPKNQDPLMLAFRLATAARNAWGIAPRDLGADYLAGKFDQMAQYLGGTKNLTAGTAGEKSVTMNVSSPLAFGYTEDEVESIPIKVYAVGVAANGEVTRCIPLDAEDEE